jgi:hypothetical protein
VSVLGITSFSVHVISGGYKLKPHPHCQEHGQIENHE